jgi:hypothetical protein
MDSPHRRHTLSGVESRAKEYRAERNCAAIGDADLRECDALVCVVKPLKNLWFVSLVSHLKK